jgi:hypothetical protein
MSLKPEDVRLHSVETSKGQWGIYVQSVVESENKKNLFMTIILERNIDDEHIMSRRLAMSVSASELASPSGRNAILNLIREWIEMTEGDGSIDGASQSRLFLHRLAEATAPGNSRNRLKTTSPITAYGQRQ